MTLSGELLIRPVVGTVLGGVIGYQRNVHGRPAGLRTHLIVALASTTFMLVSRRVDDHRIHVTLQAEVPVGGSERLVGLLESQPGLEHVRVEPIA